MDVMDWVFLASASIALGAFSAGMVMAEIALKRTRDTEMDADKAAKRIILCVEEQHALGEW